MKAADATRAFDSLIDRGWGKAPVKVEASISTARTVDWDAVPLERRRELLAATTEVLALAAQEPDDSATEH